MTGQSNFPHRAAPLTDGGYARDSAGRAREGERMSGNPAAHSTATEIPGVGHAGEGRYPIRVAIKFPHRMSVEHTMDFQAFRHQIILRFHGGDGSELTVILSEQQANALVGIGATDPVAMARDLYVAGHIEVDEYERRLNRSYDDVRKAIG